jgi:hypothetical protein
MLTRHSQHHDRADNGKDSDKSNNETLATPACCSPRGAQDADDLDHTERDVKKNGLEVGIAKVADDEVAKGGYAAARYAV